MTFAPASQFVKTDGSFAALGVTNCFNPSYHCVCVLWSLTPAQLHIVLYLMLAVSTATHAGHTGVSTHVSFLPAGQDVLVQYLFRFCHFCPYRKNCLARAQLSRATSTKRLWPHDIIRPHNLRRIWQTKLETRTLFVMREKNVNVHDHKILWTLSLVTWRKCQINENKIHRNLGFQHNRTHVAHVATEAGPIL